MRQTPYHLSWVLIVQLGHSDKDVLEGGHDARLEDGVDELGVLAVLAGAVAEEGHPLWVEGHGLQDHIRHGGDITGKGLADSHSGG